MEGLIPLLLRTTKKKQRTQNAYRCLSENYSTGRSYHLLLAGDSVDGSSHRRSSSDFHPPAAFDHFAAGGRAASGSNAKNGSRQSGFTSATQYHVSAGT